jgi:arylsulfatase A-like enzyme
MTSRRPNFLFIITDQHRADHLGCYGNRIVRTPSIDSLAARGRRFQNFFVNVPICMPNRASIMTGRMASLHGALHNGIPLSRQHVTFVDVLRAAGYRTALVGKSHLQAFTGLQATRTYTVRDGYEAPSPPLREAYRHTRRGPDYDLENIKTWSSSLQSRCGGDFYGFEQVDIAADHADAASGDYLLWARAKRPDFDKLVGSQNALPDNRINAPQAWRTAVPEDLYSTRYIEERTIARLHDYAATRDQPFFIQMSFPDPHHPFTPPGRYWDMYDPATIPLPASFGKGDLPPIAAMRDALRQGSDPRNSQSPFAVSDREAREIIALTYGMISMIDDSIGRVLAKMSDLGLAENTVVIFTSDHGDYMGDHGLMLKMLLHYRGLIRVPFIWSEPGIQPTVDTTLGSSIDIASSVLSRAGIELYNGMQGRDLLGDPAAAPDSVIIEEDSQRPVIGFERLQRVRTIVTARWRMSVRLGETWGELFDLDSDPHEIDNLWDAPQAAGIKHQLFEQLALRLIALQERSPLPAYRA